MALICDGKVPRDRETWLSERAGDPAGGMHRGFYCCV